MSFNPSPESLLTSILHSVRASYINVKLCHNAVQGLFLATWWENEDHSLFDYLFSSVFCVCAICRLIQ